MVSPRCVKKAHKSKKISIIIKYGAIVWSGSNWLSIASSCMILWTRLWAFGTPKWAGDFCWPTERQSVSEEWFFSNMTSRTAGKWSFIYKDKLKRSIKTNNNSGLEKWVRRICDCWGLVCTGKKLITSVLALKTSFILLGSSSYNLKTRQFQ